MAFFHTILSAAWLLSLCLANPAVAQDGSAPAPEPSPSIAEAAPAESAPAESAPPEAAPSPVPAPVEVARASSRLELREEALNRELAGHPLVLPGLSVGIGIPAAAILLPIGALLIEDGNTYKDYPDDPAYSPSEGAHERRVGAALVSAGILATAAAIYGSLKIHSVRGRRRAAELELAAIRALRLASGSGSPATASLFGAQEVSEQVSRQKKGTTLTSRGKKMITGGVTVGLDSPSGHARRWNLGLTPGFAYFIADRVALGASLLVSRRDEELGYGLSRQSLAMGGSLRMIYELRLGSHLGLWLWPSLGYAWSRSRYQVPGAPPGYYYNAQPYQVQTRFSSNAFNVTLTLPLMVHLTESWGLGAGPDLAYWLPMGGEPRVARVALSSFLVGSF